MGGQDSFVSICDTNGNLLHKLTGHEKGVANFSFSPDNKLILTIDGVGIGRIWNTNGQIIGKLVGGKNTIEGDLFTPNGLFIVTFSIDSTLTVWNYNGSIFLKIKDSAQIACIALSPNGENILIGNLRIRLITTILKQVN